MRNNALLGTDFSSFSIQRSLIHHQRQNKNMKGERQIMGDLLASIFEELEDGRITEQEFDRTRETLRSISKEPREIPDPLERYYCSM